MKVITVFAIACLIAGPAMAQHAAAPRASTAAKTAHTAARPASSASVASPAQTSAPASGKGGTHPVCRNDGKTVYYCN
jgi:Tfp pilus assembly protein FimT